MPVNKNLDQLACDVGESNKDDQRLEDIGQMCIRTNGDVSVAVMGQ